MEQQQSGAAGTATTGQGRRKCKPSCADCYFGRRMLCALELDQPCSTFRPDGPDGLVPPTQPMLLVRGEPGAAEAGGEPAAAAAGAERDLAAGTQLDLAVAA